MAATQVLIICAFVILTALPIFDSLPIIDESEVDVSGRSPLEYGDKFQGDIVLTSNQEEFFNGKVPKTGLLSLAKRWPKNSLGQVVVPYTFNAAAGFSKIV